MALPSSINQRGTRAAQPAATAVAAGTFYIVSDEADIIEYSNGTAWALVGGGGSGGEVPVGCVNGRLTLTTGVPVPTADVTGASNLFFTPYNGNQIALYDGADWQLETFSQMTLALSGLTSGKNYDAFIDYNGGTPQLVLGTAWTDDTTRAVALTLQDGVYVLTGATDHRYVGTIRTTSTTTTEDSGGGVTTVVGGKRFVWNAYNRVPRAALVFDSTANWSYTTDTWRQARANAGNQIEYVVGLSEDPVTAFVTSTCNIGLNVAKAAKVGIGIDSTSTASGRRTIAFIDVAGNYYNALAASYDGYPGLGYHTIVWLERGADVVCVFIGSEGDGSSGLSARLFA